jgi:hypothetical protein
VGFVYVFERQQGTWIETQRLHASDGEVSDNFGWSIAVDGELALVGTRFDHHLNGPGPGAAYLFRQNTSTGVWAEVVKFSPADGEDYDRLGHSVAIAGDVVVVGAPYDDVWDTDSGSAYVFDITDADADGLPDACQTPPGDLDGDGDVDLSDLGILLANFGCCAAAGGCDPPGGGRAPCPGDADADGDTELGDLGVVLANFGG